MVVFVYNVCTDFPAELASVVASCAQSAGSVPILVALTHIDQVRREVIGTWAMHFCVPAASSHGCHIRTGTGLTPCHIRTGTGLTPCHIRTGTGQGGNDRYDRVVFACPASAAANVLESKSRLEATLLRAIR